MPRVTAFWWLTAIFFYIFGLLVTTQPPSLVVEILTKVLLRIWEDSGHSWELVHCVFLGRHNFCFSTSQTFHFSCLFFVFFAAVYLHFSHKTKTGRRWDVNAVHLVPRNMNLIDVTSFKKNNSETLISLLMWFMLWKWIYYWFSVSPHHIICYVCICLANLRLEKDNLYVTTCIFIPKRWN